MQQYLVTSEIRYAARFWNAGEVVEMPPDRAEKYLKDNKIEPVKASKKGGED